MQALADRLFEFQKSGYLCDTVIVADDGEVKAHSAVLAARSPVFQAALSGSDKLQEHTLILPGIQLVVARIVIEFIYTGKVIVPSDENGYSSKFEDAVRDLGITLYICRFTSERNDCDENSQARSGTEEAGSKVSVAVEDETVIDNSDAGTTDACNRELTDSSHYNSSSSAVQTGQGNNPQDTADEHSPLTDEQCQDGIANHAADVNNELANSSGQIGSPAVSFVCDSCGRHCKSRKALRSHMRVHGDRQILHCSYCTLTFNEIGSLQRHETLHTGEKKYLCQYCAKSFQQRALLLNHVFFKHNDKLDSDPSKRPFACQICQERFYCMSHLSSHIYTQHEASVCEICGNRFSSACTMKKHVCDRRKQKDTCIFKCTICNGAYVSVSRLTRHVLTVHSTDDKDSGVGMTLACPLCNTMCESAATLKHHIMMLHQSPTINVYATKKYTYTSEKLFVCFVCEKRFVTRQRLENHQRVHSGEKPYRCAVCGKHFKESSHLRKHMSTHSDWKAFKCSLCSSSYKNRVDLRHHSIRVHDVELPSKRCRQLNVTDGLLT